MWQGIGLGALTGAVWGMVFLVPQLLPGFTPFEQMAGRYVLYGVVSLALVLPRARSYLQRLTRADYQALLWLSLLGNLVYYVCLAAGVQLIGIAPTSLVVGMLPVVVAVVGSLGHGEIPLRRLCWPLLAIVLGVLCTGADVLTDAGSAHTTLWQKIIGLLAAAGALFSWSAYALGNARYLMRHPRWSSHDWSLLTGVITGALAAVVALVLWCWPSVAHTAPRNWAWFLLLMTLVAIFPSIVGTSLWNAATRRLPITLGGQLIVFETVFALLYGFIYEARWPHPLEIVAMVLLIAGVLGSSLVHARHTSVTAS